MLEKPRHVTLIKILRYNFFQLCLTPTSKEEEIFGPKILMMVTIISFFYLKVWLFGGWAETSLNRNCKKFSCTETTIAQPPKYIDRSSMWHVKDNGQGNRHFSNTCQRFSFLAKHNFLKDSFTTPLYLLDFNGLWPTFGLFHYAKLPSYKRVRWGRLAGPSPM